MTQTAPYGTWKSPITAEAITGRLPFVADVLVDESTEMVYHLENRPSEGGRTVLLETKTGREVAEKEINVRSSVHEYGGGAAVVRSGVVYVSNAADQRVYRLEEGKKAEAVTPESKVHRFADFDIHPTHPHLLVSILEDHTDDTPSTVVDTLCIIDTRKKSVNVIVQGADFYSSPRFSPDGTFLAWLQWNHPDMPWEGTELHIAEFTVDKDGVASLKNDIHVAGRGMEVSIVGPSWTTNDTLLFTSDESGYQNPWRYSVAEGKADPILSHPLAEDFGGHPAWSLGCLSFAIIDEEGNHILFSSLKNGRNELYVLNIRDRALSHVDSPYVDASALRTVSRKSHQVVFIGSQVDKKAHLVRCTVSSFSPLQVIFTSESGEEEPAFPVELVSIPRAITLYATPNEPLYVVLYEPHNPEYAGSSVEGEKPPCVVNIHGGPTMLVNQSLDWNKQYYTSRGWAWLDVNYGGSSSYGRAYTSRLTSQWGVLDVEETIFAAKALSSPPYNLVDRDRLVVRGGSSGGFTALACISYASDLTVFAACMSRYGISNLKALVEDTHKFESKYMEKLLGGTFEECPEVYKERSPITHADVITTPLLLLQGDLDRVVPKEQSDTIYESISRRNGIVEYQVYEGEGHGFRQEKNMRDAMEREIAFYERILKLNKV